MQNRLGSMGWAVGCYMILASCTALAWAHGGGSGGGGGGGSSSHGGSGFRGGSGSSYGSSSGSHGSPSGSVGGSTAHTASTPHTGGTTPHGATGSSSGSSTFGSSTAHTGGTSFSGAHGTGYAGHVGGPVGHVGGPVGHVGGNPGYHAGYGAHGYAGMHTAGSHWNGYNQANFGNHSVHLAYAGYHPSYYYHNWYHGPWGGNAFGWGWGFGPGVAFGLGGVGLGIGLGGGWGYGGGGYGYGGGGYGYGGGYGPYGYMGRPLGWGFGGWGLGTMAYSSGYYPYSNPYYSPGVYQNNVYNYSNPIPVATQGPPGQTAGLVATPNPDDGGPGPTPENYDPVMDAARQSFRQGDYGAALASVDAALAKNQTDAVMHEFRSLVLFARRDYKQAAAVAHSVLAVGPGWDWTTMSSLYPDPQTYTDQLHALEDYVQANPNAADAHFLLGYHYMIGSHAEASAAQFQQANRIMPSDRLAGELAMMAKGPPQQAQGDAASGGGQPSGQPSGDPPQDGPQLPAVDKAMLPGNWSASRNDGSRFRLVLNDDGTFNWKFSLPNQKGDEFSGTYSVDGPVLMLERKTGGALAGTATFNGDNAFNFKMVGGPPQDKGLDFTK